MLKVTTYLDDSNMPYLVKEETAYSVGNREQFTSPDAIYELTKRIRMTEKATETVLLLIFDTALHCTAMCELSNGSVNRSIFSVREIAQTVLLAGGVAVALAHNHPSGNTTPSDTDIATTRQVIDGLKMLGIDFLDHIVVGKWDYHSMKENEEV